MSVCLDQVYEQTLVIRSQLGEEIAFTSLMDRYGPRLLAFTQRMMHSSMSDIPDISQDIWIAIFRALPSLVDASKFRPWAFRIARDRIYREYRRRKLPFVTLDETNCEVAAADAEIDTFDSEELRLCLKYIGPEHREVLVLRFLEEMSYEDIARVTGVTIGTVRSRIHYAKLALRSAWESRNL